MQGRYDLTFALEPELSPMHPAGVLTYAVPNKLRKQQMQATGMRDSIAPCPMHMQVLPMAALTQGSHADPACASGSDAAMHAHAQHAGRAGSGAEAELTQPAAKRQCTGAGAGSAAAGALDALGADAAAADTAGAGAGGGCAEAVLGNPLPGQEADLCTGAGRSSSIDAGAGAGVDTRAGAGTGAGRSPSSSAAGGIGRTVVCGDAVRLHAHARACMHVRQSP